MTVRSGLAAALLALAGIAMAAPSAAERANQELRELRNAHPEVVQAENHAARDALRDAIDAQQLYFQLERDLQMRIVREESLIHRDRRYVAESKPAALLRRLQAEREEAAGERRRSRLARLLGRDIRGLPRATLLLKAEQWAIDAVYGQIYLERKRTREICDQVLKLAEEMEREAQARKRAAPGRE